MKKTRITHIMYIVSIILFALIFKIDFVGAASGLNINTNVISGKAAESKICTGNETVCATNEWDFENSGQIGAIEGMRLILYKTSDNSVYKDARVWFDSYSLNSNSNSGNIGNLSIKKNDKVSSIVDNFKQKYGDSAYAVDVFNYYNFIDWLTQYEPYNDLINIINAAFTMNISSLVEIKNYYLVIEPIFAFKFLYFGSNYIFAGNVQEVANVLNGTSPYAKIGDKEYFFQETCSAINNECQIPFGIYFLKKESGNVSDCEQWIKGKGIGGSCGNWNLLKNYLTVIQLESKYGTFTSSGNQNVQNMVKSYDTNIYGKAIINISELIPAETETETEVFSCSFANSSSCLYANLCYKEETLLNDGVTKAQCIVTFKLTSNNVIKTSSSSNAISGISGQLVSEFSGEGLASATLTRTCYVPKSYTASFNESFKYSDYVSTVKLAGEKLIPYSGLATTTGMSTTSSKNTLGLRLTTSSYKKYSASVTIKYSLPSAYLQNGTGYEMNTNCSTCKTISSGYLSSFASSKSLQLSFAIDFSKGFKDIDIPSKNSDCIISLHNELVDETLQLEFRSVDTDLPFLNSKGEIRKEIGDNWKDRNELLLENNITTTTVTAIRNIIDGKKSYNKLYDMNMDGIVDRVDLDIALAYINSEIPLSEENKLAYYAMNLKNDSANKTGEGPKYIITLTPSDIIQIRNYNKNHNYDDYNLTCTSNGYNCISNFLTDLYNNNKLIIKYSYKRNIN